MRKSIMPPPMGRGGMGMGVGVTPQSNRMMGGQSRYVVLCVIGCIGVPGHRAGDTGACQ